MKRFFLGCAFVASLVALQAFNEFVYEPNYSTAEVAKIDGLLIFTDSKPIMPHEILGMVDLGFVSGTQYESIRNSLVKRVKKTYPNADGIILNLNKKGVDNCYVLKFK